MDTNMNNHQSSILTKVSSFMCTRVSPLLILALAASFAGCTQGQGEINRVQTNIVSKDMFTGEWWVNQTVLDADAEASFEGPGYSLYAGGSGWTDYAVDRGQSPTLARIRWVIDENFLFAYRSYEIIDGGNLDGDDPDFRGQPIAAYAIEDHVDVRTQYSGVTGEQTNVIEENTSDQRWYDRPYMRVDWSMNHVNSFSFLIDDVTMGNWQQESVPFFIPDADSHNDFPDRYAPQFVRIGEDEDYRFRHEWPEGTEDTVHYMSFTTMSLFSPGPACLQFSGIRCNTISVPLRTAFLRIPPEHTFASQTQDHSQYDRFGLFRSYQRSYINGGAREIACDSDADCGSNGYCRPDEQLCSGLSANYGETDFLTFLRPVHNIWRGGLTDQACGADFQCTTAGSECDLASSRCTIPLNERERNPVVYHLNEGYPAYLVKSAFEVMGNWNEVYMRGWRSANNEALPDYTTGTMTCQNDDPTAYCACGSADDVGGECKTEYNPFTSPAEWAAMGVTDAFDCYAVNPNGAAVDPNGAQLEAEGFGAYPIPATYEYEFVGTECTFYLASNTCDLYRTDINQTCEEAMVENDEFTSWQQHGDLRYQFFNYIHQAGVPFGGLSEVRGDVKTGELLASDANINGGAVDGMITRVIEWFPVLRCASPAGCAPGEENADIRYLEGENVRDYFDNLGRTVTPVNLAPSGSDGTGDGEGGRPALPIGASRGIPAGAAMADGMLQTIVDRLPRINGLRGEDAGFNTYSSRIRNLAGTTIESGMLEALGSQAMQANFHNNALTATTVPDGAGVMDPDVLERISPFRGQNFIEQLDARGEFEERMAAHNACFTNSVDGQDFQRSRYWEYWAEAFRGRSTEEASIRMAQQYLRAVQHHEVGHSVGLRHNFAGSLDRNNYGDGYFNLTVGEGIELPQLEDYDLPENGGDADGFVGGTEVTNYQTDLNDVRDQRADRGAHNYMTASIMDYNGDVSDSYGLGRYDQAAILWSTFGKVEAYEGDPRISSEGSSNDLHARFDAAGDVIGRQLWTSYEGGQSCDTDSMCPNAFGSALLSEGQPVYQRCIRNTRNTRFQEQCGDGEDDCVCSNFDNDFDDYRAQVAYDADVDGDGELDFFPVNYLFCSDGRTSDISWCTRFDVGESFQETLAHYRRSWYESYANVYNRRFRSAYSGGSVRMVREAVKIYQHLFFRIFFEPGFTSNDGPLGFRDQFSASVDAMNWFIELINLPDEGSYEMNPDTNVLELVSSEPGMPGADVSMGQGLGFGMWSEFQEGHRGWSRTERAGTFYDKFFAIYALTNRDWNLDFSVDEAYRINFYDLFEVPMTEFFGGIITNQPSWFAPRYDMDSGEIEHMTWYRGLLLGECGVTGARIPCRGSNEVEYPVTATRPAIGNTTNVILRSWATILALNEFAVFYATDFTQRLLFWRDGDGIGHNLPDVFRDRRNGAERPYCAYGAYAAEPGHVLVGDDPSCTTTEDANYAVFQSDRLHFAYVAEKVYTRDAFNLEEEQLGFAMLRNLIDLQDDVRALEGAGPSPELTAKREALFENESFLAYIIDLQGQIGINRAGF